jgi:hypothetical protein
VYPTKHVAILLRNIEECSWEERLDLEMAMKHLDAEAVRFLSYVLAGWSIREAGRRIGKPGHTHRRFMRYCRTISMFLNGGNE